MSTRYICDCCKEEITGPPAGYAYPLRNQTRAGESVPITLVLGMPRRGEGVVSADLCQLCVDRILAVLDMKF